MTERRKYDAEFKARVVLELISGQKGLMQASREYGIKDTLLSRWKQEFLERASQVFEQPKAKDQNEQRLVELERMVGRLTMQLDMAKSIEVLDSVLGKRIAVQAMAGICMLIELV
jgi:transposase-like protein